MRICKLEYEPCQKREKSKINLCCYGCREKKLCALACKNHPKKCNAVEGRTDA